MTPKSLYSPTTYGAEAATALGMDTSKKQCSETTELGMDTSESHCSETISSSVGTLAQGVCPEAMNRGWPILF